MSDVSIALLTLCCLAILLARRQWAPLPLLVCALYIPLEVGFVIGPFNFFALRVVLAIAVLRVLLRRETIDGGLNGIDRAFLWWSAAALLTSFAHADPASTLVNRLGLVYTGCGTYFVLRIFCRSADDVDRMCRTCVWLLVPVALEMLQELQTGRNLFSEFGGRRVVGGPQRQTPSAGAIQSFDPRRLRRRSLPSVGGGVLEPAALDISGGHCGVPDHGVRLGLQRSRDRNLDRPYRTGGLEATARERGQSAGCWSSRTSALSW